jgi:hypothetical protein
MMGKEVVMDRNALSPRPADQPVVVASFGMTGDDGFLDAAPLDRNVPGTIDVDRLVACP